MLKDQAEADKARAELVVAVASILSGPLLMATVARTSLRAVAGNALLNFVCNRSLERTFNAFRANRPWFSFGGGPTPGDLGRQELRVAETQLDALSERVRPSSLLQVRS